MWADHRVVRTRFWSRTPTSPHVLTPLLHAGAPRIPLSGLLRPVTSEKGPAQPVDACTDSPGEDLHQHHPQRVSFFSRRLSAQVRALLGSLRDWDAPGGALVLFARSGGSRKGRSSARAWGLGAA